MSAPTADTLRVMVPKFSLAHQIGYLWAPPTALLRKISDEKDEVQSMTARIRALYQIIIASSEWPGMG